MHLQWHYQILDEDKKRIYRSLLSQIREAFSGQCGVTQNRLLLGVPGSGILENGILKNGFYENEIYNDILMGILLDNPLLFQLDLTEVSFYRDASSLTMILKLVYDSAAYPVLLDGIRTKAQEVCVRAGLLKTKRQKILYLHDYLCGECECHVHDGSVASNDRYLPSREIHTIIGALQNENCVCDGFASAFLYLCEQCGIACIHVRGQLVRNGKITAHAWNMVGCKDMYWHMDLCLDCLASERTIAKEYCFRTDMDLEASHRWEKGRYPKTDGSLVHVQPQKN